MLFSEVGMKGVPYVAAIFHPYHPPFTYSWYRFQWRLESSIRTPSLWKSDCISCLSLQNCLLRPNHVEEEVYLFHVSTTSYYSPPSYIIVELQPPLSNSPFFSQKNDQVHASNVEESNLETAPALFYFREPITLRRPFLCCCYAFIWRSSAFDRLPKSNP